MPHFRARAKAAWEAVAPPGTCESKLLSAVVTAGQKHPDVGDAMRLRMKRIMPRIFYTGIMLNHIITLHHESRQHPHDVATKQQMRASHRQYICFFGGKNRSLLWKSKPIPRRLPSCQRVAARRRGVAARGETQTWHQRAPRGPCAAAI